MFSIFKKNKSEGETLEFKIEGMHCVSCGMNIDGELEDMDGVVSSKTSYAKGKTVVKFYPDKISMEKLKSRIEKIGYRVM